MTLHLDGALGFTLESVTPGSGSCWQSSGAVDCSFGAMASGASATIVLAGPPGGRGFGHDAHLGRHGVEPERRPRAREQHAVEPGASAGPKLVINDVTVNEPKGLKPVAGGPQTTFAIFTLTLTRASSQTITVDFTTADGTATAGMDYTPTSGQVHRSCPERR